MYQAINDGHAPLKIVQASNTRWLSIETATSRILSQWLELTTHFNIVRTNEKCYNAQQLYSMYSDDLNKAYLQFLRPHSVNVQRVNKIFEGASIDPTKMFDDLCDLISNVVYTVAIQRSGFDPLKSLIEDNLTPNPYLGYEFENTMKQMKESKKLNSADEQLVRKRCGDFLVNLAKALRRRLPHNISILRKLKLFSIDLSLRVIKEPIVPILEELKV